MAVAVGNLQKAADLFLSSGRIAGVAPDPLALECDRVIRQMTQHSSVKAVELAHNFVRHARKQDDALRSMSYRSLGWTLLVNGSYKEAEKAYLRARSMVLNDAMVRGRIDRVLIDVFMYLGDFSEAERRARLAQSTFQRLGAEEDIAKTRVNYANLLHRQDRHRQAKRYYEQATAFFEAQGADIAVALCS